MNTEYKIIYPEQKVIIPKKEKKATPDQLINTLIELAKNEKINGVISKRKAQELASVDFGKIDIWRICPIDNIEKVLFTVVLDDGLKLLTEKINKMFMDGGLISFWGTYKGFPIPVKDYVNKTIIELSTMDEFEKTFLNGAPVIYSWQNFQKMVTQHWRTK